MVGWDSYDEGKQQAEEALEICERLGDTVDDRQKCLISLARFLVLTLEKKPYSVQLISFRRKARNFWSVNHIILLGDAYQIRGKMEKAIYHFEVALGIATAFDWHDQLFRIHFFLADAVSQRRQVRRRTHPR
jgi:tetratricopeptide (TPR) repeat protein